MELVYSPASAGKHRLQTAHNAGIDDGIRSKRASFLNLTREIRDEIYVYALVANNPVYRVRVHTTHNTPTGMRVRERLPQLYYALPCYSLELLEAHYKTNTIHFLATYTDNFPFLLAWLNQRGELLTRNARSLELTHRVFSSGPYYFPADNAHAVTTIHLSLQGKLEVSTRSSNIRHCSEHRGTDKCDCGIEELVRERLSREDALEDSLCVERVDESVQYGPLFGFALRLCEAMRLMRGRETVLKGFKEEWQDHLRRLKVGDRFATCCDLCRKGKWAFCF